MARIVANCETCRKEFSYWPSQKRRWCSRQCSAKSRIGKPRDSTEFITYNCERCSKEVVRYASGIIIPSAGRFCSRACKHGERILKHCLECGKEMFVKQSLINRKKYCSRSCQGKSTALAKGEVERNWVAWNKGRTDLPPSWNKGLRGYRAGPSNGNWKGGKTALMDTIRTCTEYKNWRTTVFERDGYQCVLCGKNGQVVADHIKPLAVLVDVSEISTLEEALEADEIFDVDNGRTLCRDCHSKTDTFGVNFIRWEKQQEYL